MRASAEFEQKLVLLLDAVAEEHQDRALAAFAALEGDIPYWLALDFEAVPALVRRYRFDECLNLLEGIKTRLDKPKVW